MSTETVEDTKPVESTDDGTGEGEKFHYVRRDQIIESAVEGRHVVALCGETFPVTKVPKKGSPVCTECKRIYDGMKK